MEWKSGRVGLVLGRWGVLVHSTSTQRTLRNLNFALRAFQQQSRRMQKMKTLPKMMLLLQMTLSFSFLCNRENLIHFETVALRNTCIPRHSKFETLALLGRDKEGAMMSFADSGERGRTWLRALPRTLHTCTQPSFRPASPRRSTFRLSQQCYC